MKMLLASVSSEQLLLDCARGYRIVPTVEFGIVDLGTESICCYPAIVHLECPHFFRLPRQRCG